jgi:uncharacterized protein (TIGR02147 family)
MRAFARDMSISPSRLSEVMNGKGDLSKDKAVVVTKKLRMSPSRASNFLDLIDGVSAPLPEQRDAARSRVSKRAETHANFRDLSTDDFKHISDPLYLTVWCFMQLPKFDGSPATICAQLKINGIVVFDILRRLESLNLIRRDGAKWIGLPVDFTTAGKIPSSVVRDFHKELSSLGQKSIQEQTINTRVLDSIVIPFNSTRLGEIHQRITAFSQSLMKDFGDESTADSVYGMSLQFFRMAEPISDPTRLTPKSSIE